MHRTVSISPALDISSRVFASRLPAMRSSSSKTREAVRVAHRLSARGSGRDPAGYSVGAGADGLPVAPDGAGG